jgi:hypothetical protein
MAAAAGGIQYRTLRYWEHKGKKSGKGKFFQFFQAVQAADLEGARVLLAEVRRLAFGDEEVTTIERFNALGVLQSREVRTVRKRSLQAILWILERRYAKDWGKKETEEVAKMSADFEELRKAILGAKKP